MSYFRPTSASPPPRPTAGPSSRVSEFTDDSQALGTTAPELTGLSAEDINFIDDVISRAPANASTFLTIFKAYNDVLQERGLDPQNEVVYYGKLLKIGTLKGKNWVDKWNMVKEQQGYVSKASTSTKGGRTIRITRATPTPAKPTATKPPVRTAYIPHEAHTVTVRSYQNDLERSEDEPETKLTTTRKWVPDTPRLNDTPRPTRRFLSPATFASSSNSLGLDTGPPSTAISSTDVLRRLAAARARTAAIASQWDAETATQASSMPPSYGAAVQDDLPPARDKGKERERPPSVLKRHPVVQDLPPVVSAPLPLKQDHPILQQRERRGSAVDAEDAFKKIQHARDEEEADRFRNDRLVERCYEVWKQGYEWIIATGEQIAEARDSLILRRALHQWRKRTATKRELYLHVASVADHRFLKRFFQVWKLKVKEKKQVQWRKDMRSRMKVVRERDELRLKKDMWAKWRQSYQSHLSEKQFACKVLVRFFNRWKVKLQRLDELDAKADHFALAQEQKTVVRLWDVWRHIADLRGAEKVMKERIDRRIMTNVMDVWRRQHYQYHVAERFNNLLILKHTLRRWQVAQMRIRSMENRAVKHVARRDDVLVRAIMRIWKAREQEQSVGRARDWRLVKQVWDFWKQRMEEQKSRDELAQLFQARSSSILAASMLKRWREVYQSHQSAQSFAVHYHGAHLQYKMLFTWRLQLREKLRLVKQAKVARKHLLLRRCLRLWASKVEEKQRDRKLRTFELRTTKNFFEEWRERTKQQRAMNLAEQIISERVALRVMTNTLRHWITRVADLKFREDETRQSYSHKLVLHAYNKWKALCKQHVDELSLMESYQDIKREENMRKMFYRWLAAAKKARHRRLQLQAKEEEFTRGVIAVAWDKWRERYQDNRLQPLADAFIRQRQVVLLFRAFAIWKTKSLSPEAVKFRNSNLKKTYWNKWKALMPRALQAKTAREFDRRNTLRKALATWKKAQQRKIDTKAINYARYLELLSSAPRQAPQTQRPQTQRGSALVSRGRTVFPTKRPTRPATPTEEDEPEEPLPRPSSSASRPAFVRPPVNPNRMGIASLLTSKPRTASPERKPRSPERPKFSSRRTIPRDPSPSEEESDPAAPPPSYGSGIAAWRKEVRPFSIPPKSAPASIAGDVAHHRGRGSLWEELKEVRRRSRAPTERMYSPEPL